MFLLTIAMLGAPVARATGDTCSPCPEPDETISGLGTALVTGDTCGQGDDFVQGCGGTDGEELSYRWSAPSTATYRFDTDGSDYDTALTIHEPCPSDVELACNDDEGAVGTPSVLEISLMVGEEVIVNVEGFGEACGDFQVNVAEVDGDTDPVDTDTESFAGGATASTLAGEAGGSPWSDGGCGCETSRASHAWWGLGLLLRRR